MSTDRRGRSRTNRLMAVPPLRAKQFSVATCGSTRTSKLTCRRYASSNAIKILRYGDLIGRVELAAIDQFALAGAEIDRRFVETFQPGVAVAVGVEEEEPLHFHAAAGFEKCLRAPRAQGGESLEELVDLVKTLSRRQFVEEFEDGALGAWKAPSAISIVPRAR